MPVHLDRPPVRFIPAGAGNSRCIGEPLYHWPVHPRGRGEQIGVCLRDLLLRGSSPRARGTVFCDALTNRHAAVHPRGRGEQRAFFPSMRATSRFIPAGAGNRPSELPELSRIPVHPRGRGERLRSSSRPLQIDGSSPRARGTGHQLTAPSPFSRFIPAGAGNGYSSGGSVNYLSVHPRGRGERIMFLLHEAPAAGSSPRARGTVIDAGRDVAERRFIPAGAGNGYFWQGKCYSTSVHPRGRGERKSTRVITAL